MKHLFTLKESMNKQDWAKETNCDDVKDILYGFHDDFYKVKVKNKTIHIKKEAKIDLDSFSDNYKKLLNDIKGLGYTITSSLFDISNESASVDIKYIDETIDSFTERNYESFIYQLKEHVFYSNIYDWGKGHIQFEVIMALNIQPSQDRKERIITGKFNISLNSNYFEESLIKEFEKEIFDDIDYECNQKNYEMLLDIIKYLDGLNGER